MAFAQARVRLDEELHKLDLMEHQKEEYEQTLRGEMEASLNVQEIIRLQEGIATIKWHMSEQQRRIIDCENDLEERRQKLTEAIKERKIQEKLREHAFEAFRKEEEQAEQKGIDELISYQYGSAMVPEDMTGQGGSAEYAKE